MHDFCIIAEENESASKNLLALHLAALPSNVETVGLVAALFSRYKAKNRESDFRMRGFNMLLDPHGLLVGINDSIAVFWRSSCGYFWLYRSSVSFQHEAAFIPRSCAPIIDVPRLATCYRFQKGETLTLAIPIKPSRLADEHASKIKAISILRQQANDGSDDEDGGASSVFRPDDGFTLLGGDRL